jgi:long-chain acyl-CoA synthetase
MSDRNLVALHRRQAERLGPCAALRYKRYGLYHDLTWRDYREQAVAAAAALVEAGIAPGDRVGLLAENRLEWLVADMAIMTAGAVNVPPHAPLTAAQIQFQLADAGVRWLFVSTRAQADKVRQVRAQLPRLEGYVLFERDPASPYLPTWEGFLQRGRTALARVHGELEQREQQLTCDSLATIMYTSGTTGNPKGVMLTHGNLLSNAAGVLRIAPHKPDDVVLNWLPFSHIYARLCDHYMNLLAGISVCLAESAETVVQNLEDVQPTHLSSVPRFYEKVYAAVSTSDPAETARRLRRLFGPRMDWMTSGGAPLPVAIAEAYHRAGLMLLQGYGLTESSPVISFNNKEHFKLATVGLPLPGVEVRIAPDGEVLTRGPHVMKGYWNNPEATAEAVRGGWLYTGDLGKLDEEGFLQITGRKKELLVMSNGKKVVPSYLEGLLLGDPCIDQAVVHGEGRNFLTALLVPNWDNVRNVLAAEGVTLAEDAQARTQQHEVVALLDQRVRNQLADVSNAEQVRKFIVLPQPFSVAAEEMTVSLKLRRNVVLDKYAGQLDALYQE